jgi:hypothetical protein
MPGATTTSVVAVAVALPARRDPDRASQQSGHWSEIGSSTGDDVAVLAQPPQNSRAPGVGDSPRWEDDRAETAGTCVLPCPGGALLEVAALCSHPMDCASGHCTAGACM